MMLVEVTSDSSEEYDTVDKLHCYRTIPTLHDYIIVSHRERRLTLHRRTSIDTWATHVAIAGGRVVGSSLNAELVVDEMYRGSRIA